MLRRRRPPPLRNGRSPEAIDTSQRIKRPRRLSGLPLRHERLERVQATNSRGRAQEASAGARTWPHQAVLGQHEPVQDGARHAHARRRGTLKGRASSRLIRRRATLHWQQGPHC